MIAIDNILVSDEVLDEQFVCDLTKCKGGCCEDGDAGAPLEDWERKEVDRYLNIVKPYMTAEGLAAEKNHPEWCYHHFHRFSDDG